MLIGAIVSGFTAVERAPIAEYTGQGIYDQGRQKDACEIPENTEYTNSGGSAIDRLAIAKFCAVRSL